MQLHGRSELLLIKNEKLLKEVMFWPVLSLVMSTRTTLFNIYFGNGKWKCENLERFQTAVLSRGESFLKRLTRFLDFEKTMKKREIVGFFMRFWDFFKFSPVFSIFIPLNIEIQGFFKLEQPKTGSKFHAYHIISYFFQFLQYFSNISLGLHPLNLYWEFSTTNVR